MAADFPTLVLVPGAWHQASCYSKIAKLLQEKHGLRCVSVTLPTTGGDPAATFKDDLDAARAAIAGETSQGHDVVVVAHSYGGIVGNSAVKGFTRPKDGGGQTLAPATPASPANKEGHVVGTILIASGCNLAGMSFMDPFFGIPPPAWRVNKETGFAELVVSPRDFFYHDVPDDEAAYWVSQLRPQSLRGLFEGAEHTHAGWLDVPVWYIGTIEDRGLPVAAQRMGIGMAREMGANIEHRELKTSHSPFLSQPEKTVDIMLEAVEAFSGREMHTAPAEGRTSRDLSVVPEPRLLQPLTWLKFGLPLLFGRFMGRSILIFRGIRSFFNKA
ncbi:Alpha/beta hydrolase family-domain-containing protein [Staphylotrichum tortipilum]|uniref:Alpha/beta hydrolase family-domain-containing protein n=1 Tax=Staphylotrichum tortipilum TaxID=2831512 RepID=A0AAN6RNT0_9PEZI|nr:Alpha/beta hydrolase family-domain-containing protein [Staphylotrichum longicolle]